MAKIFHQIQSVSRQKLFRTLLLQLFLCHMIFGETARKVSGLVMDFNPMVGLSVISAPKEITAGYFQTLGWRQDKNYLGIAFNIVTSPLFSDFNRRGMYWGVGPEYHRFFDINDSFYLRYGPCVTLGSFRKIKQSSDPQYGETDYETLGYGLNWQTSVGWKIVSEPSLVSIIPTYLNLELTSAITYNNVFKINGKTDTELLNLNLGLRINVIMDLGYSIDRMRSLIRKP